VCLCLRCFEGFHCIDDLMEQKSQLKEMYETDEKKTAMDWYDEFCFTTPQDKGRNNTGENKCDESFSKRKRKAAWTAQTSLEEV
jgi:hypothetical protein